MKGVFKVSLLAIAMLAFMVGSAMAAKPQDVIEKSNGFPSGMHFNLNIHGKEWVICNAVPELDGSWGNSLYVPLFHPEDGEDEDVTAIIQYFQNKRSSFTKLIVHDPCAGFDGQNDVAKVQLPYKIEVDGELIRAEGYHVFGRILGTPNNGRNDTVSSIILYPNVVVEACNDPGLEDFGDWTSCDEMALGLIVGTNLYIAEPEVYRRFDPGATPGKGKSKATDITRLFIYVGWVVDERLDISGPEGVPDGVIDEYDVPDDAYNNISETQPYDSDGNGVIDIEEWLTYNSELTPPMAWYFDENDRMWIFDIADLVVTEQGLYNDGTRLLQIRFYPVATTEFGPE